MAGFLKILLRNVLEGPSTDPFPLGETFTPKRFRGKVALNADLCMGCGICRHTCAAGAINIHVRPDQSGYDFTVWHNSCCLCASCRHYCPTGAITLTTDWHNAHAQEEKFTWLEQKFVPYVPCEGCGTPMRPVPPSIAKKIYINNSDVDIEKIIKLCPKCRQIEDARKHATPLPQTGEEMMETDAPKEAVKAEAPKAEAVKAEAPKAEAPKAEVTSEAPKAETVTVKPVEAQAAAQTPEAMLEKALDMAVPTPEKTEPKPAEKSAPVEAAKPAKKPEAKPEAKAATAPKPTAAPKATQQKPSPSKNKGKGKKTK